MAGVLASLLIKLGLDASAVEQGMAQADKAVSGFGSSGGKALKAAAGVAGAGLAFAAKGALQMEEAAAAFQAQTGASAAEAEAFAKRLNAAAGNSLVPMEQLQASAIAIRTDLGLTGDAAAKAEAQFAAYQRATGQGAEAVLAFDDILDNWNLSADDAGGIMDKLITSHQKFGGSLADNQKTLAALAPAMQAANMEVDDGIALLGLFGAKGLDANVASAAFAKALTKVKSPEELQAAIADIANTQDSFERASKAADLFGARAGAKLANALGGADLDDYAISMEDAAGATAKAADVLDNTMTSKLKLALNQGKALLRGFGMEVGPILTGAMSGISFAKTLGLDRALGPVFQKLGGKAAGAFSAGMAAALGSADKLIGPLTSKLGPAMDSFGKLMGGRFGTAFKAAGLVGLGLLIADELRQLGEVRQQNVESAAANTKAMQDLLKEAPTRAEAEAKLAGLKAIPENLNGIQGAVYGFADFAKGNVLGSVVDGLFGSNPAANLQEQTAALEAYIAGLPPELDAAGKTAGAQVGGNLVQNIASGITSAVTKGADAAAAAAASAGSRIGARWAGGVTDGIQNNVGRIQTAWDAVGQALQKGPKLQSYKSRLAEFRKATEVTLRRMRAAVKANDPVAASYYAQQYQQIRDAQGEFRRSSKTVWGDVATIVEESSGRTSESVGRLADGVTRGSRRAQRAAERSARKAGRVWPAQIQSAVGPTKTASQNLADATKAPLQTVANQTDTYGTHAGDRFADGLSSQVPDVSASAAELAQAVRRFIAFSAPPKVGPLKTIKSWGPHMVDQWTKPMAGKVGQVQAMADRLAAAAVPQPRASGLGMMPAYAGAGAIAGGAVRGVGGGDQVHIHVGTLIANDAGLDELERRMDRRRHLKRRDRRLIGDQA